jgi:AcrR family transcriptional regulator
MPRPERERQMLDVAEEVFGERGYRAASMDEIAERCGVSKPMLYEYFGSKDGLLLACVARSQRELGEVTARAIEGLTDPREILWRGMVAYFAFIDSHRRSFGMLVKEPLAGAPGTADAIEAIRRQQSALIAGVLSGFAADAPADVVEAYTEIIMGASERLSLWRLRRPGVTAEQAAAHMTDFCWTGLSPFVQEPAVRERRAATPDPGGAGRPPPG